MSTFIQASTNGRLHPATEPSIAPINRGFLYGDAIYEVWRSYHGVLFAWEEHWERLLKSAEALHMTLPFSASEILTEIRRTVEAFLQQEPSVRDLYVRLQITRGGGAIGLDTLLADRCDFVLLVQENKAYSAEKFRQGLRLSFARQLRRNSPETLNPAWKTGNYLNNILCLREARARGADEVVITNLNGEITEAAVSNIGFVREGVAITPPLSAGLLAGITRRILLERIASRTGIPVLERSVTAEDLGEMSECFILSTTKDLTPVAAIDEHVFQLAENSVTLKLKAAFAEYTREYAQRRPELRVVPT